jgi:hypothetical protein
MPEAGGREMIAGAWVVEWNEEQKQFHVDELARSLKTNLRAFARGRSNHWDLMAVCESQDEANQIISELRKARNL